MCNFRSIPWYCRYVVIGHNSNFGKDLIFTIVMTQTHFKTRSTRLPTEMMTLRRLSWSQIYVFIRKRVISLEKKIEFQQRRPKYLWTLSSRFWTSVIWCQSWSSQLFERCVALTRSDLPHGGWQTHCCRKFKFFVNKI